MALVKGNDDDTEHFRSRLVVDGAGDGSRGQP